MARSADTEDTIRMRRIKGTIEVTHEARKVIGEALFGAASMQVESCTIRVEALMPADTPDLIERTAEAERLMGTVGNIRTVVSGYTRILAEDAPPQVEDFSVVEKEDR